MAHDNPRLAIQSDSLELGLDEPRGDDTALRRQMKRVEPAR